MAKIPFLYDNPLRHATWFELFFDLVFVAAIGVVTHDLANTHNGHIELAQFMKFVAIFVPLWWIWVGHTLYSNWYDRNHRSDKLVGIAMMVLVVSLAIFSHGDLQSSFTAFAGLYVLAKGLIALQYLKVHVHHKNEIAFNEDMTISIGVGALISASAIFIDSNWKFVVFYGGLLFDMLWQYRIREKLKQRTVDKPHLVERLGLFAIIILGESMINIVRTLSEVHHWTVLDGVGAVSGFIMACSIWWIYFDSYHLFEKAKKITTGQTLIYMHLFVCMGLLILANLIRHSILGDLNQQAFGLLAIIGLTFFYIGKQFPYVEAFPVWKKQIIINTLVCVGITFLSTLLPDVVYSLVGMMGGLFVYIFLTYRYVLNHDLSDYLEK